MKEFEAVIVDEAHGSKAIQLKKILSNAVNSKFIIGTTGTMPEADLDDWNVKAYLGPIIREYSSGKLAELGYIANCNIKMLNVNYQKEEWDGTYDEVKDEVFNNPHRMKIIKKLIKKLDHNVLVLVGKVEKEGEVLEDYLNEHIAGKEIGFLSGRDSVEEREKGRKKCTTNHKIISLKLGKNKIEVDEDEIIPLSNGKSKKSSNITKDDDIDDLWIKERL